MPRSRRLVAPEADRLKARPSTFIAILQIEEIEMMSSILKREETFESLYSVAKTNASKFDGMMSPLSIGVFAALFDYQDIEAVYGNCIEFGVFRGRSAAVALSNLRDDERMMLVDVAPTYPEFDKLRAVNPNFDFIAGKSENLVTDKALLNFLSGGVRFTHHDASHSFINVDAEMRLLESNLNPRGVMVLDDFCNPSFMQVVAACFSRLAERDCDLELFLYSNNKAYLCKKNDFGFYATFVVNHLLPKLKSVGFNVYVSRTDDDVRYRGFSLVHKTKPEDPDFYGLNTYGNRYYRV